MSKLDGILQSRQADYGDFTDNAQIAQALKSMVCFDKCGAVYGLVTCQEAADQICSKLSRLLTNSPVHEDTWRDIAGYATLVADRIASGAIFQALSKGTQAIKPDDDDEIPF